MCGCVRMCVCVHVWCVWVHVCVYVCGVCVLCTNISRTLQSGNKGTSAIRGVCTTTTTSVLNQERMNHPNWDFGWLHVQKGQYNASSICDMMHRIVNNTSR